MCVLALGPRGTSIAIISCQLHNISMAQHTWQSSRYHLARDTLQYVPHPRPVAPAAHVQVHAQKSRVRRSGSSLSKPSFIEILDDSELWRVDTAVDVLRSGTCTLATIRGTYTPQSTGGVGIIPTDTFPAVVCDLENRDAVERLYSVQGLRPSKLLSIIVRNFKDVSTYSLGFAVSNAPGQVGGFSLAKRLLPGPVRTNN